MEYQTRAQSSPAIDAGLRQYMLSVYNYMVVTGISLIIQFLECMRMQEYRKYTADQMR